MNCVNINMSVRTKHILIRGTLLVVNQKVASDYHCEDMK